MKNKIQLKTMQVGATMTSLSNTSDGGKRIGFRTQELSVDEKVLLEEYFGSFGYLLFKENAFKDEEIPKDDAIKENDDKSPSKRLKDRMFVYYNKKNKTSDGFNNWYVNSLNKMGLKYLEKIIDS